MCWEVCGTSGLLATALLPGERRGRRGHDTEKPVAEGLNPPALKPRRLGMIPAPPLAHRVTLDELFNLMCQVGKIIVLHSERGFGWIK